MYFLPEHRNRRGPRPLTYTGMKYMTTSRTRTILANSYGY